jgi:hypothetical protein
MKTSKKILSLTLLSALSLSILAQNTKLELFVNTVQKAYPSQILIGYFKDQTVTGLIIKSDTSYFEYRGRLLDKQKNEYIVFDYFSEPVGYTSLYLISVKDFEVYSSQAILENEVPLLFSFDKSTLVMWKVSLSPPNCGKNSILSFEPKALKKYKIEELKAFKSYLSIDLK